MDVYLIDEIKNYTFHFPVNPLEKINIKSERRYTAVDIIDIGEVDIFQKGEKIKEISFNTLLPHEYDSSYCRYFTIPIPIDAITLFEYWQNMDQPIRLIITDFNFNSLVTIAEFTGEERSGEIGDIYLSILFRSYRELKIENISSGSLSNNRSTNDSDFKKSDKVKVTASALNVRKTPNGTILGSVAKGTTLEIYSVSNNWADVLWGNNGGYICLDYVVKV